MTTLINAMTVPLLLAWLVLAPLAIAIADAAALSWRNWSLIGKPH